MTIDHLPIEVISLDQLDQIDQLDRLDQLAGDVVVADVRLADAAVPDPPPGSGTAAVLPAAPSPEADQRSPGAGSRPVPGSPGISAEADAPSPDAGSSPVLWPRSARWAEARVVPLDPAAVAVAWLTAVRRGDWTTAWSTTDPNLRLALAQQWLDGLDRTGDNVTAWSLAAEIPHIGMWAPFAEQLFPRWSADLFPTPRTGDGLWVQGPTDHHLSGRVGRVGRVERAGRVGWVGRLAQPDVGRELCVVDSTVAERVQPLTLRLRDRWRIAGLGRGVLQPGWPARWIDLDLDLALDHDLDPGHEPAGNLHPNGASS